VNFTVVVTDPRLRKRNLAEHAGLTASDARELARVYVVLGHSKERISIVATAGRPDARAARFPMRQLSSETLRA
jgi:hypothetical protein